MTAAERAEQLPSWETIKAHAERHLERLRVEPVTETTAAEPKPGRAKALRRAQSKGAK